MQRNDMSPPHPLLFLIACMHPNSRIYLQMLERIKYILLVSELNRDHLQDTYAKIQLVIINGPHIHGMSKPNVLKELMDG